VYSVTYRLGGITPVALLFGLVVSSVVLGV
jgi:hypothetical protein